MDPSASSHQSIYKFSDFNNPSPRTFLRGSPATIDECGTTDSHLNHPSRSSRRRTPSRTWRRWRCARCANHSVRILGLELGSRSIQSTLVSSRFVEPCVVPSCPWAVASAAGSVLKSCNVLNLDHQLHRRHRTKHPVLCCIGVL